MSWRTPLSRIGTAAGVATLAGLVGAGMPAVGDAVFSNSAAGILTGVLLVMAAGAPTVMRLRRHPLDAPGLYAAMTMLVLGLTSLAWLGDPIGPGPGLSQADVAEALRLVAIGLVAFGLGAWLVARTTTESPRHHIEQSLAPSSAVLVVMFAFSVLGATIAFAAGTYGYISDPAAVRASSLNQILNVVTAIGLFAIIATALSYFATRESRLLVLLVLFTATGMIMGFVAGFKGTTLLPLTLILGSYVMVRRRWPVLPIVAGVLFVFVVLVPTNQRYREGVRTQSEAPRAALGAALTTALDFNPAKILSDAYDYVDLRFRSIDYVALILDQTPSPFDFAGGENYVLLPAIAVLPRSVWQDKPVLDEAEQFTQTYNQAPPEVVSSTQLTQVGDLYRNFGYTGVVVGMFCVGLVTGGATWAVRRYQSPRAELVYVYVVMTIVIAVESDLPAMLASASKTVPVAALVSWFLLPGRYGGPGYRRLLRGADGSRAALNPKPPPASTVGSAQ